MELRKNLSFKEVGSSLLSKRQALLKLPVRSARHANIMGVTMKGKCMCARTIECLVSMDCLLQLNKLGVVSLSLHSDFSSAVGTNLSAKGTNLSPDSSPGMDLSANSF